MQCLKVLTMSGWNPPPGNRKMHGDLMYLYIVTAEERHVSVTASTRGFYLNQSVNIFVSYPCFHCSKLAVVKLHNLLMFVQFTFKMPRSEDIWQSANYLKDFNRTDIHIVEFSLKI